MNPQYDFVLATVLGSLAPLGPILFLEWLVFRVKMRRVQQADGATVLFHRGAAVRAFTSRGSYFGFIGIIIVAVAAVLNVEGWIAMLIPQKTPMDRLLLTALATSLVLSPSYSLTWMIYRDPNTQGPAEFSTIMRNACLLLVVAALVVTIGFHRIFPQAQ